MIIMNEEEITYSKEILYKHNKNLLEANKKLHNERDKYKNIVKKAIKYCNSYSCWTGEDGDMYESDFCIDELLDILEELGWNK